MDYLIVGIIIVCILSCPIFFYYAAKSYFEYKDAKSSKFREASVSGKVVANDLKACSHPDKVLPPPLPIRSENESRRFIQRLREFNSIDIDDGQTSLKELGTPAEAKAHAEKQAAGKVKKGYKEAKVKAAKKAVKKKAAKKVTKKVTKKKAVKKKATKKKAAKKKA